MKRVKQIKEELKIALNRLDNMRIILGVCKSWRNYALWRFASVNNQFAKNSLMVQLDDNHYTIKNLITRINYPSEIYYTFMLKNPYNVRKVIYSANSLLYSSMYRITSINNCRNALSQDSFTHILKYNIFTQLVKECREKKSKITHLQIESKGTTGVVVFDYKRIYLFQEYRNKTKAFYKMVKYFKPKQDIIFLKYQNSIIYFTWLGNICETPNFINIKIINGITF